MKSWFFFLISHLTLSLRLSPSGTSPPTLMWSSGSGLIILRHSSVRRPFSTLKEPHSYSKYSLINPLMQGQTSQKTPKHTDKNFIWGVLSVFSLAHVPPGIIEVELYTAAHHQGAVMMLAVTLSGNLSAVFLRPTQVKWQLMVASCYRRSGENESVLTLGGGGATTDWTSDEFISFLSTGNYQKALETYKDIHRKFPENTECNSSCLRLRHQQNLWPSPDDWQPLISAEKV